MKLIVFLALLLFVVFITPAFSTNPTAQITSPTANQILSNVTNNGSMSFAITGTASDPDGDFQQWILDYGIGSNPTSWPNFIGQGSTQVINATFTQWQTQNIANQTVQIRLRAFDVPQHITTVYVVVTIGNFSMSQNKEEFNSGASGNITYTSIIPAQFTSQSPLTQTISIKNEAGTLVRTLVSSVPRPAGTYNDTWDGKNDSSNLISEGAYFYTSYVVNGSNSMTWDVSNQFVGGTPSWPVWVTGNPTFDGFNNLPWNYNFNLTSPARITLNFSTTNLTQPNCNAPQYCEYSNRYASSGIHYGSWLGMDNTGALRPELDYSHVHAFRTNFPKNAVIIFGIKPTITNLAASPPVYKPSSGQNQTISFTLATYQSQTAPTAVVSTKNLSSATVVRTLTVNNVTPGNVNISWDGKASNGNFLSPDVYVLTLTLTDAIGHQETAQIFTTVRY
ncbi:hypothetical protein L0244_37125 [bacterium]|nr:hypothetical protein [bacterium]